ncbi:MAG: hypothetical protein HFACDABA_00006 [Anaerolineales bacterium]|nr:hypothetical protein [Anaerolineales bacterium]
MNRNTRLFTPAVIFTGLGFACLLTFITWIGFALTAAPRSDLEAAPAVLTLIPAPTSTPLFTATPTRDPLAQLTPTLPANYITVGSYVQISGTGGDGLRIRSAPNLAGQFLFLGEDSEVFKVEDGPKDADNYIWWYIVAPYDVSRAGWAAANFLSVVPPPQ